MTGTPAAEVRIDTDLVRSLIRDQHPQYAKLSLRPIGSGWDNVMMRLGSDMLVRLPRRSIAVPLIEHEQRWLPELAPRLPIAVPAPIHVGRPSARYPWPWSISAWLPGEAADLAAPRPDEGRRLAEFLAALHHRAPPEAPLNPVRGVPLINRADSMAERIHRLRSQTELDSSRLEGIWLDALEAPAAADARWLHGDLHPLNILVLKGRIVGIIDWGDITGGDIATDLAAFWMMFDGPVRRRALAAYGDIDEPTRARARGWAVLFGAVLLDTGLVDHPRHAAIGAKILRRLVAADERLPEATAARSQDFLYDDEGLPK
ncbi:MAG: aminoglycoside phosphotransferase family protein [Gammaproteobacteria bacterium]|nr:aminoglycoside phosphotransferase family protein [Gammaproteobacteria bacterium]